MCDKATNTCPFVFNFVPGRYKTRDMRNKDVFK